MAVVIVERRAGKRYEHPYGADHQQRPPPDPVYEEHCQYGKYQVGDSDRDGLKHCGAGACPGLFEYHRGVIHYHVDPGHLGEKREQDCAPDYEAVFLLQQLRRAVLLLQ